MTPPKLSVDAGGRVHGTSIAWNNPWPCQNGSDGGMVVPSGVTGMLVHTQVGNNPGSVEWFNNGASQASAHFCVAQDGSTVQMGPVNGWKAWHAVEGSAHFYGVEFADAGAPSNPLTQAQIATGAQLLEMLSRPEVGRFPMQISDSPGTEGLGWHGMGGAAFGGHYDCPGDVRKGQRPQIIALAQAIRGGGNTPPPAPAPTVATWTCQGQLPLSVLAATKLHCGVSTVLRLTAEHSPHQMYPAGTATYLNQVFAADKVKVPTGITLHYPKASTTAAFNSHGDQTLLGLSEAWHCEPSAIVRLTAENSPGAVFSGAMASYLDGVFARSTVHVPTGTVLYYEH